MAHLLYKTQTRDLFHTRIKLKFSVFYDDTVFDILYKDLEDINKLYNSYSEGSYIDRINKNAGQYTEVDDETISLLKRIIKLSEYFNGEFDITIMPLIRLWGFYKNGEKRIPEPGEIEKTRQLVDYKKIVFFNNKAKIDNEQEIITGSFIKAYAVDKMIDRMQETGITDAIVNAGGSTIKALTCENHPYWTVSVKHPESNIEMFTIKLSDKCYSTSAQNKTFIEIGGKKYGHIINPVTGYPSANKQVGIISDNCFEGDIISTGLFNLPGNLFINKMKDLSEKYNVEGFLIDKDNKLFFSDNFKQYITEYAL